MANRPSIVSIASWLLIADALLSALSVDILFRLNEANRGWVLPFQPGVWVIAFAQVWIAVLLLRRVSWVRYPIAALVLYLVVDNFINTSWQQRFASFPASTLRDVASLLLQSIAIALLFSRPARAWFRRAANQPSAT